MIHVGNAIPRDYTSTDARWLHSSTRAEAILIPQIAHLAKRTAEHGRRWESFLDLKATGRCHADWAKMQ